MSNLALISIIKCHFLLFLSGVPMSTSSIRWGWIDIAGHHGARRRAAGGLKEDKMSLKHWFGNNDKMWMDTKYISFVLFRLEEIPGPWKLQKKEVKLRSEHCWKRSNIPKIVEKKVKISQIVEKSKKSRKKTFSPSSIYHLKTILFMMLTINKQSQRERKRKVLCLILITF